MKQILTLILAFVIQSSLIGQSIPTENIWKTLSKITYKKEYDELMGFKIDKPVFGDAIKSLEGKEVTIKVIFSAFPYSMCFFCGGAGPETVMEVEAVEGIKYSDEAILLKGTMKLNDKDINRLMYKLVNAKLVKS